MSIFDDILGNLEETAGKFGIPAETLQAMAASFQSKLGDGTDHIGALMQAAQEHGFSMDKVQEMLGASGGPLQDMLGKATEMLSQSGSNPFDMVKGLFGKD